MVLLNRVRRVSEQEARDVIASILGEKVAATVRLLGGNAVREYTQWDVGDNRYHLGTFAAPYPADKEDLFDEATEPATKDTPTRLLLGLPADDPRQIAWINHTAFFYVDAVASSDGPVHAANVLRIARRFIDDRCVLIWRHGTKPPHARLPTPEALAELGVGRWPVS